MIYGWFFLVIILVDYVEEMFVLLCLKAQTLYDITSCKKLL